MGHLIKRNIAQQRKQLLRSALSIHSLIHSSLCPVIEKTPKDFSAAFTDYISVMSIMLMKHFFSSRSCERHWECSCHLVCLLFAALSQLI
uniref:Ovule protein n=1 Tax=Elaeophora elaphi TaxID=1147741 RepID=A0A0R3RTT0_9BILA